MDNFAVMMGAWGFGLLLLGLGVRLWHAEHRAPAEGPGSDAPS